MLNKDFIIVANGPFLRFDLVKEAIATKFVIALDGAGQKLLDYHIIPDLILGDFDSIDLAKDYANIQLLQLPDQEFTDLEKAIIYCDEHHAQSITIICATGGREDHTEALKHALRINYRPNRKIIVHTAIQSMCYAQDEVLLIDGQIGDICAIIADNGATFNSQGLMYECNNHNYSVANKLISNIVKLQIFGGALVIMPPQLASQRLN